MSGGEVELTMLGTAPTLKKCAACGVEFSCGAPAAGCWCEELQITPEVLRDLRAHYADCLCQRCLSAAARNPALVDSESAARFESRS